jgi:Rps23 Pro-64 3,4-dihydroxylase Tpa1-like proline 4-hydroxylase
MLNLTNFEVFSRPYQYIVIKNAIRIDTGTFINEVNQILASSVNARNNDNFQKTEVKSAEGVIGQLLSEMQSSQLLNFSREKFSLNNISGDLSYDGGGFTVTPQGGFLRYHADFPYSSSVGKYRVLNALMYLCDDSFEGGELHLIDPISGTVEARITPKFGTIAIFPTSKYTPHGVSRIIKGNRLSINSYFYDSKPLDDRLTPSKTMWLTESIE